MPDSSTQPSTTTRANWRQRRAFPFLVLNLVIVLIVAGGTVAYGALSHTVTLVVDGRSDTIRTFGDTVGDVLEAKNVTIRPGDRVSADPVSSISDGDRITVSYAKPVTLTVDGDVSEHTVYEPTVGEALETLGVEVTADDFLSAKASARVPRAGMALVVSSNKSLTVIADGEESTLRTTAPRVSDVLKEAGVSLDDDDEVEPGLDEFVVADQKLKVVRIKTVTKTETVKVDHDTTVREDPDAPAGETTIITAGQPGTQREKVTLVFADGTLRERKVLATEPVEAPVTQVVSRGTKREPISGVWAKLAQCESGGNPRANNSNLYFGLYQFSLSTWAAVGGSGNPMNASSAEQTKRAKILQARSGWGQWPACARKLGLL